MTSLASMKADSTITATELATARYNRNKMVHELSMQVEEQNYKLDSLSNVLGKRQSTIGAITSSLKEAFPNLNEHNVDSYMENNYVNISLDHRILFNRGEQELTSDGKIILSKMADVLKKVESDLMILGHTDSLPIYASNYDNWMLSLDRAHAVAKVLVAKGVKPERLIIAGRSKHDPRFENDSQIGRLLNRRIELVLMPDMEKVEDIFAEYVK